MSFFTSIYELHTDDGTHVPQPSASQLAGAIAALAAPGNTWLCMQSQQDTDWYVEVTLLNPETADLFDGPYLIHYEDRQASPTKWSVFGDDPQTIAARITTWVQSMINSRCEVPQAGP